jgi:hypothetical protein
MTEELTPLEISFLYALENLPEEYGELLLPPFEDGMTIPCKERKIGDLHVKIFPNLIYVNVGGHTKAQFKSGGDAVKFIHDVVTDDIVFHFHDDTVDYYRFDDFLSLSDAGWHFYVWSGPFRYVFLERQRGL